MSTGDFPDIKITKEESGYINLREELKQRTMDFYWKKQPTNRAEQIILDELDAPRNPLLISKAGPFLNSDLTDVVWPENRNNTTGENLWTPEENNIKTYTQTTYADLVVEKPNIKPQYLFAIFNNADGVPNVFVMLNTYRAPLKLTCDCYSEGFNDNCVHIRNITSVLYMGELVNCTIAFSAPALNYNEIINLLNLSRDLPLINYLPYGVMAKIHRIEKQTVNSTDTSIGIDDFKKSRNITVRG